MGGSISEFYVRGKAKIGMFRSLGHGGRLKFGGKIRATLMDLLERQKKGEGVVD